MIQPRGFFLLYRRETNFSLEKYAFSPPGNMASRTKENSDSAFVPRGRSGSFCCIRTRMSSSPCRLLRLFLRRLIYDCNGIIYFPAWHEPPSVATIRRCPLAYFEHASFFHTNETSRRRYKSSRNPLIQCRQCPFAGMTFNLEFATNRRFSWNCKQDKSWCIECECHFVKTDWNFILWKVSIISHWEKKYL